jgi:hypothetical protein
MRSSINDYHPYVDGDNGLSNSQAFDKQNSFSGPHDLDKNLEEAQLNDYEHITDAIRLEQDAEQAASQEHSPIDYPRTSRCSRQ